MRHLLILLFLVYTSCSSSKKMLHYNATMMAKYPPDKPFERILLLNNFDVTAEKFREPKEQLFTRILDSMLVTGGKEFQSRTTVTTVVLPGFTSNVSQNIVVWDLMRQNNASHAVVINSFNVFFSQTRVDVTKTSTGKEREAFYDIIADAEYSIYDQSRLLEKIPVNIRQQHSSRNVISGLLAAGPDIVNNSKDAFRMALTNVRSCVSNFFPVEMIYNRPVFTAKEFAAVGAAVGRNDYEAALVESLRFVNDPDTRKASKANYNCAVFMERKGQSVEVKTYLQTSLKLSNLSEAVLMMKSYR